MTDAWPWLTLVGLGAYHGINPAMGWLFAVALGLQQRRRHDVVAALGPIAVGHALSIGAVVALFFLVGEVVSRPALRIGSAAALIAVGLYRLVRARHPRWRRMHVGRSSLTLWSFLMASAHGAGLLLLPVFLGMSHAAGHGDHAGHAGGVATAAQGNLGLGVLAVTVHTVAYLVVTGAVAVLVYEKLGLSFLRRAWWNLDRIWAIALLVTGALTLLL